MVHELSRALSDPSAHRGDDDDDSCMNVVYGRARCPKARLSWPHSPVLHLLPPSFTLFLFSFVVVSEHGVVILQHTTVEPKGGALVIASTLAPDASGFLCLQCLPLPYSPPCLSLVAAVSVRLFCCFVLPQSFVL